MFVLTRYQGTESGYVPVGRPRPWDAALQLLKHANAVNGDVWFYRLRPVSPELPRFRCADQPLRYVIKETAATYAEFA